MIEDTHSPSVLSRLRRAVFGAPRNVQDPGIFHKMALIPFLAWIGLGSDGLSSSAYGPDEAFRNLGTHQYLALFLCLAMAVTVLVISLSYSHIIEQFPTGGGGYVVATKLLGEHAGVISGAALLVDYILTVTVSIAAGGDAVFSLDFMRPEWVAAKVPIEVAVLAVLIILNLRGVKESVTAGVRDGVSTIGFGGLFIIFLRAYSMGGGTYTGIEAVSNGLQIMREPRVQTGKRTMMYMALSLAFTASGILLCYLLFHVEPIEGQTMNAVLANAFAGKWAIHGVAVGRCCSSPRRPASSTGRASCRTWRSIRGYRIALRRCRTA
jgi:amino acid transporter